MKDLRIFSLYLFLESALKKTAKDKSRLFHGRSHAENVLQNSLSEKTKHNYVDYTRRVLPDKETAVSVAETMLFKIYGRETILSQKPYEIHLIEQHWVISGSLPSGAKGDTFVIILDSRDSRVVMMTHRG